jgi:ABC-type transport system substrate-binding protein
VTVNPVTVETIYDRWVVEYLFTPLVYLDQDLQPIPALAESWDISDDGRVYRFELNEKATFSDGTPCARRRPVHAAEDRRSEVGGGAGRRCVRISRPHGTKVIDDHTIEIAFREPLAAQLVRFNDVNVLPEHVYAKGNFRNDFNTTAVGSGPYRLVKREPGKEISSSGAKTTGPEASAPARRVQVISDHGTAWAALRRSDVDESRLSSDVWLREAESRADEEHRLQALLHAQLQLHRVERAQ